MKRNTDKKFATIHEATGKTVKLHRTFGQDYRVKSPTTTSEE